MIELIVPAEENFAQANNIIKCKYADLIHKCQEVVREVKYFSVEVGSRGFTNVNKPSEAVSNTWTYPTKTIRKAIDDVSKQP